MGAWLRMTLAVGSFGLALAGGPAPARAEIWVVVENPNRMARAPDVFELFDRVCNVELPSVSLRGQASTSFPICGGLGAPGNLRIRYAGEQEWVDVPRLHGWSVIEAPRRPIGATRPARSAPGDDE